MRDVTTTILLGAMLAAPAAAETISFDYAASSGSRQIAQFDPSLGTLQSAVFDVTGTQVIQAIDNTPEPVAGSYAFTSFYSLYYFDRFFDFNVSGSGNVTYGVSPTLELTGTGSATGAIAADRLPFVIGTGTFLGSPTSDYPYSSDFGPGVITFDGGVSPVELTAIRITYTYLANAVPGVPDAPAWAMMIAGFGAVGGALRRRGGIQAALPVFARA